MPRQAKASIQAKVEHPFHVVKNLYPHRKARYKGLVKNMAHLFALFGAAFEDGTPRIINCCQKGCVLKQESQENESTLHSKTRGNGLFYALRENNKLCVR